MPERRTASLRAAARASLLLLFLIRGYAIFHTDPTAKAQVRPMMKYCSSLWEGFPNTFFQPYITFNDEPFRLIGESVQKHSESALGLRLLALRVPSHTALGSRPAMSCSWALGPTDVLYSVKWYKDGKEFFRHVPRDVETRRKFILPGVEVETADATGANLTLAPVTLQSGGRYRCEVSGERPLFPTVSDHSDMIIVALPEEGPTIVGSRPRYQIGDHVHVNCTSGRSKPATRLAWFINGEPAASGATGVPSVLTHPDGLDTSSLTLDFKVKQKHFRNGDLKLKCLATIATVYWRSNEESVQGDRLKGYTKTREVSLADESRADRVQASSVSRGLSGACAPACRSPFLPAAVLAALLATRAVVVR